LKSSCWYEPSWEDIVALEGLLLTGFKSFDSLMQSAQLTEKICTQPSVCGRSPQWEARKELPYHIKQTDRNQRGAFHILPIALFMFVCCDMAAQYQYSPSHGMHPQ
jgi:hypothetical protein